MPAITEISSTPLDPVSLHHASGSTASPIGAGVENIAHHWADHADPQTLLQPFALTKRVFENKPGTATQAEPKFPFFQQYTVAKTPDLQHLGKEELAEYVEHAFESRQGIVELAVAGKPAISLAQQLNHLLKTPSNEEGLLLSNTLKITGIRQDDSTAQQKNWTITLHDVAEEESYEIPLTEISLQADGGLEQASAALDSHLQKVQDLHPAYSDSVFQPVILGQHNTHMAHQLVTYKELQSQIDAKQIQTTEQLASKQAQLSGSGLVDPALFQSIARYFDSNQPNLLTTASSAQAQTRIMRRHMYLDASVAASAALISNNALNLENKAPAARPLLGGLMYREPAETMQCGANAVNTFFQQKVATAAGIVRFIIENTINLDVLHDQLPGIWHPQLVAAMLAGEPYSMSKQAFLGSSPDRIPAGNDSLYNLSPREQWNELVNAVAPRGPNKNWVEHAHELNAVNTLTISPSHWLSAYGGVHADNVKEVIQHLLSTTGEAPAWAHYPKEVKLYNFAGQVVDGQALTREEAIDVFINQLEQSKAMYAEAGQDFPMVVLQGRGNSGASHYFSVGYNGQADNWASLNSNGTQLTGAQPSNAVFAATGGLREALINQQVSAIICPTVQHTQFEGL